jgi:hypothetical protein
MKKCLQFRILSLSMAVAMLGWAQGTPQPVDQPEQQEPPPPEKTASGRFPLEVAGEVNFRYLNDDALQEHHFFREYSASLFLSKTIGRWRFHTELNADTSPEFAGDGIALLPRRPSVVVEMDSGFVNYNHRDWLQVQAGFLFIPTYWRIHRYQSTTLTVPSRQFFRTFDIAIHRLHRVAQDGHPDETYGVELQLSKSHFEVLGEFAHSSLDVDNGVRNYIRQGYYIQPSYGITPRLFAVVRYDRLDRDSRYADQSSLTKQSVGLTYRPIPIISLKIEGNRYEPQGARLPAYYGVTTGLSWFFHLP